MNAKVETQVSKLDSLKLGAAVCLALAAIGGFYYFADQPQLMRVLGLLVVVGVAVAIASQTEPGRTLWRFALDSRTEVRKVVWPTRTETVQTTLMVFLLVVLVAILLWLLDMMLLWAVRLLTVQGG